MARSTLSMPSRRPPTSARVPAASPPGAPAALAAAAPEALLFAPDAITTIPATPGVYLMRDAKGDIIYVGKSVNLRQRVRAYFTDRGDGRLNTHFLRPRIARVEVFTTRTDKEAILLEIALIQQHRPRYNFRLTDDKSFFSIRLDRTRPFPRLEVVRTRAARQDRSRAAEYFGPYDSTAAVKRTISELLRIFQLRSCTDHVMNNRTRPCVLHEIGKCCAPCVDAVAPEEYAELVDGARRVLLGRTGEVVALLEARMQAASDALEFEAAARARDQIAAIRRATERQGVQGAVAAERDAIAFVRRGGRLLFVVLRYRGGDLAETTTFVETDPDEPDEDVMRQFLLQFYAAATRTPPPEVLLGAAPGDDDALAELADLLAALRPDTSHPRVRLLVPRRGPRRAEIDLALANADQALNRALAGEASREQTLGSLADRLGLPSAPRHIECFDISTFQGTATVGVMVCFRDGEPARADYRKFIVRSAGAQPDDFAALREVLERRYRRVLAEGGDLPDLILIDGGKGQLRQAIEIAGELGLHGVPLAAIAKSRLRTPADAPSDVRIRSQERIFLPGRRDPVTFRANAPELFLLERVRDETHRVAITFHRQRRTRGGLRSVLDDIPGIGPKRRAALLRAFGSVAAVRAASPEDLRARGGLPPAAADALHARLHAADGESPAAIAPDDRRDDRRDDVSPPA